MRNLDPIGILDSGVGGITVWAEIVRLLPSESMFYIADTVNCPYGGKSHETILEYTRNCVKKLIENKVKIIVLACNSMTAAAIGPLREEYPEMLFVGMEPAVKAAAAVTRSGVIGLLATRATLKGTLYQKTLKQISKDITVIEAAGDGLVELVEAGKENSPESMELLTKYIRPMIDAGADNLVLGCTHYPLMRETIERIGGGKLNIIDPAGAVARRVRQLLEQENLLAPPGDIPRNVFMSTASQEKSILLKERAKKYIFVR